MRSIEASGDAYLIYIREFRVYQCQLFLQHKCTQHRPYSCFHWHFMNQRRRRPRMKDGAETRLGKGKEREEYNYDPDIYCDIYDEQTGICANGDSCPFVHRNAGDTERKYHPRYYKIVWCFFETDTAGNCARNGPHCHMAHSLADLRSAVPSQQKRSQSQSKASISRSRYLAAMLEKDRVYNDDTCWNDTKYVVEFYKTEPCKRPPRVCRQGYACPQYHNPRDRRRNPFKYSYRSAPCPNVKQSDEWNEPSLCEKGDSCQLCHSRTEQQFHPDIYKTTRCHDILSNSYCPRGTFCAFAHSEDELKVNRDQNLSRTTMLMTEFVQRSRPSSEVSDIVGPPTELPSSPDDRFSDKTFAAEQHHSEAGVTKQTFSEKYAGSRGVATRNSPSARDVDVQRQGSFSRRRGKAAYRNTSPVRMRPSAVESTVVQPSRLSGSYLTEQIFKALSPDEYELSTGAAAAGGVRSLTGRRARRKHRTRSGGELYRESLVKTTLGKSDMMIHLTPGQGPMKIRSLPATFMDEPGRFKSPTLSSELSFLSLASLPAADQAFPSISSSLPEPSSLQSAEEEEDDATQSKNTSSLRQVSLEAMISRNLENIGIEDANFLFEGEEKLSPKILPQGFVRFPNSSEASLVDISSLANVSTCDSLSHRPSSGFLLLPLSPASPSHHLVSAISAVQVSSDRAASFHEHEGRIPSSEPVAVEEQIFHPDWQLPTDQGEAAVTTSSESLFGTQQTFTDLLDSEKKNKLLIQRMNAEIAGLKAQIARLEQQLERALIEREDAVSRLASFVNSDKALATGRSIWAIQPAERKTTHIPQLSKDKETLCTEIME